jgi:hypothetical protein
LRQFPKPVTFDLKEVRLGSRDDLALLESSGGEGRGRAPECRMSRGVYSLPRRRVENDRQRVGAIKTR